MDKLIEYFGQIDSRLAILIEDIDKKIDTLKTKKDHKTKTIMPLTKIYKDKNEAKNASENPELDFITRGIENAFKD